MPTASLPFHRGSAEVWRVESVPRAAQEELRPAVNSSHPSLEPHRRAVCPGSSHEGRGPLACLPAACPCPGSGLRHPWWRPHSSMVWPSCLALKSALKVLIGSEPLSAAHNGSHLVPLPLQHTCTHTHTRRVSPALSWVSPASLLAGCTPCFPPGLRPLRKLPSNSLGHS